MPTSHPAYDALIAHTRQASLLGATASLLGWDQETMMPPKALPFRGEQLAQLARLCHEMAIDPRVADWLAACEADPALTADPTADTAVNLRELRRRHDRATKLPASLVEQFARVTTAAKAAWDTARRDNDYPAFAPHLRRIVELCRETARCYGHPADGEPWDALAESYEPGLTAAQVTAVFTPLRPRLVDLVARLTASRTQPTDAFNRVALPRDAQYAFVRRAAAAIGFDFDAGRLDTSAHPFCSGTHCRDTRLTTRFHDDLLLDALGSTLHEAGHGIYNQGLPEAHTGTPRGEAAGLSIHESQSRLWENQVGRSAAFYRWLRPLMLEHFGGAVAGYSAEDLYACANVVRPSLIRVEADEATYNLHIMIRFELERRLLNGTLDVDDLPAAWNTRYRDDLGVDVPDDRRGCLQDIHWSMGAFGYFPTYTLGNLYAAQFFEAASARLGDLDAMIAAGDFTPLRQWLNRHIHEPGMTRTAHDLCEHVTGRPLSAEPLMRHLESKLLPLHGA